MPIGEGLDRKSVEQCRVPDDQNDGQHARQVIGIVALLGLLALLISLVPSIAGCVGATARVTTLAYLSLDDSSWSHWCVAALKHAAVV
jgi:hypothetical protein